MLLPFTKMHGLGNDFVVLDLISTPASLSPELIRRLADRHIGIGFDQLLLIEAPTSAEADFNYRIYNCDGTEVEHCGNGARCFARYVLEKNLSIRKRLRVQTKRGIITLTVEDDDFVTVDMGTPDFSPSALPFNAEPAARYERTVDIAGEKQHVQFYAVSLGNPHAVILVDDVDASPVATLGAALGAHADFPRGVNVGFMQILERSTFKLRVFERGAGETQACGTGACAALVCGRAAGLLDADVLARLTGGDLALSWPDEHATIKMRGPATTVFEGSINLTSFSYNDGEESV